MNLYEAIKNNFNESNLRTIYNIEIDWLNELRKEFESGELTDSDLRDIIEGYVTGTLGIRAEKDPDAFIGATTYAYKNIIKDFSLNDSEDSSKGYWVKIKMKNNKQALHLFNTEDEMREYLNLLSHYVGQGIVEILDYTGKDSKKNESEYVVYTTTEIKPGEFKSDVYGKYGSSDQAEDVVAELKAKGINATMSLDESESWLTSKDIEWLSNQNHDTKLTEISMNYKPTGDIERDEIELNNLASDYFYDEVGIYNENIDSLCTRWAHDQVQKINEAAGNKLSPEEIVTDSWNHIVNELGKEPTIDNILDDIMNNYDQDYFKGETPEASKNDFDSVKAYLRRLGLHFKDLDESDEDDVWWNSNWERAVNYVDNENKELLVDEFYNGDWDAFNCNTGKNVALDILHKLGSKGFEDRLKSFHESDDYIVRYTVFDHDSPIAQDISSLEEAKRIAKEDGGDSITKYTWYHVEDYDGCKEANKTEDIYLSESDEDDFYDNQVYDVEIRDLHLTNQGYHNNSDVAWGRVKLIPKDGSGIDDSQCGLWDVIYFRDMSVNGDGVVCFKIGYPVKVVANAVYDCGTDEGNYTVKINGEDIPVDDLYEKIDRDCTKLSSDAVGAIEGAIERAIHNDDIDKVDYA